MLLEGKVALITGGNTGIGRAIAEAMAREGASVAINCVGEEAAAAELVRGLGAQGVQAMAVPGDVSVEEQVQAMVARVVELFGQIDVLVNNAGIYNACPVVDMPVETWDRMIAVHLRGTFLCTHYVLPHMLARRYGKIINTASQLGQIGRENVAHYCAAKAGIIGFTKALSREVGPLGIYVNAIAPGPIRTGLVPQTPDSAANRRRLEESLPLRRIGEVGDVAPTAVFLASDLSNYYAGQTLGPNGGDVML